MHSFAKKDTDNLGMIVKRVSVPIGLEELMEGLTKEVLLKKPKDLYIFASEYFSRLVNIRDQTTDRKTYPIRSVQSITHLKASDIVQGKKITTTRPTRQLSRQMSIRNKSPVASKNIQTDSKRSITRRSRERKESVDSKETSKPLVRRERSTSTAKKDSSTSRSVSSVQSTPREKRQNSNSRYKSTEDSNKNVDKQPKVGKAKSEPKSNVSASELKKETNEVAQGLISVKKLNENKVLPEDKNKSQDILDSDIWAATTDVKQVSKLINEENSSKSEEEIKKSEKIKNLDDSLSKSINIDNEMEDSGCENRSSISNNDAISDKSELLKETGDVKDETKKTIESLQENTNKSNNDVIVSTNDARESDATIGETISKDSIIKENNVEEARNKTLEEVKAHIDDAEKIKKLTESQVDETDKNNKPNGDGTKVEANKISLDTGKEVAKGHDEIKEDNKIGKENKSTSSVAEIEDKIRIKEDQKLNKNILDSGDNTAANEDYSKNIVVATKDDLNNVNVEDQSKDALNLNKQEEKEEYTSSVAEIEEKTKSKKDQELNKNILDVEDNTSANEDYSKNIVVATKDDLNNVNVEAQSKDDLKLNRQEEKEGYTSSVSEIEQKATTKIEHKQTEVNKNILIEEDNKAVNGDYSENNVVAPKDEPNIVDVEAQSKNDLNLNQQEEKEGFNENEIKDSKAIRELEDKETNGDEFNNKKQQSEDDSNKKSVEGIKNSHENSPENIANSEAEKSQDKEIKQLEITVADPNIGSVPIVSEDISSKSEKSVKEYTRDASPEEKSDLVLNIQMKSMDESNDMLIVSMSPRKTGESSSKKTEETDFTKIPKEEPIEKASFFRENEEMGSKESDKITSDNNLNIEINAEDTSSGPGGNKIEDEANKNNLSVGATQDSQNEGILKKLTSENEEIIVAKEDTVSSREHKNTDSLEKLNKEVKPSILNSSIDEPRAQKSYITKENTLAFNSVKDLLDFDNSLINKNDIENDSSEELNELKLIIVENESMDDSIPSEERSSNNVRHKRSVTGDEIEEIGLDKNSKKEHKDNNSTSEEKVDVKPKTLDSQDTDISLDHDLISTDSSGSGNDKNKIDEGNSSISESNEKAVSKSPEEKKPFEKDALKSEIGDQHKIKEADSDLVTIDGEVKTEEDSVGVSKENTSIKNEGENLELKKAPKIGDIEQVATVIEVIKNIFNSQSTEKNNIKEVREYLNNFLQNEQSNVFQTGMSQQSSIQSSKNNINKKQKSMLPKSKQERPLSQTNLINNKKADSILRRVRSVGVIKTPETESRSKIPTSARRSASRRPLVRQLEADSKELEEKLKSRSTSKGSGDEPLKNINGLAKDDVLIAKTILKGIEGAEKHIELIEEHLNYLENDEVKHDPKKLREEIEAASKKSKLKKSLEKTNADKDLSLDKLSDAALVIQRIWKGFQVRKILRESRSKFEANNKLDNSGKQENNNNAEKDNVKSKTGDLGDSKDADVSLDKRRENAAIKIQSAWKGLVVRKKLRNKEKYKDERAIITIQAIVRGFLQRIRYEKLKTKYVESKEIEATKDASNVGNDKGLVNAGVGIGATTTHQILKKELDKDKNLIREEKENENLAVRSSNEKQDDIKDSNKTEAKNSEHKFEINSSKEMYSGEEQSKMVKNSIGNFQIGKDALIKSNEESNHLQSKRNSSNEKSSDLLNSQTASQDLLHSSEFHATAFLPGSGISLDVLDNKEAKSVRLSETGNLKHSSEFHDIVVTPLPSNESDVNIVEMSKMISPGQDHQPVKDSNIGSEQVMSQKHEDQKIIPISIDPKDENIVLKDVATDEKDRTSNLNSVYIKDSDKNLKGEGDGLKGINEKNKVNEADKASLSIKTSEENALVKGDDFKNIETKVVEADKTTVEKSDESKDVYIKEKNKNIQETKVDGLNDKATVDERVIVESAEPSNSSKAILQLGEDGPRTKESKTGVKEKVGKLEENAVANKDTEESTISAENNQGKLEKSVDLNSIDTSEESKVGTDDNVGKLEAEADTDSKDAIEMSTSGKPIKISSTVENKAETSKESRDAETNSTSFGEEDKKIVESTNINSKESEADNSSIKKLEQKATVDLVTNSNIEDNLSATVEANKYLKTNTNEENEVKNLVVKHVDKTNKDSQQNIVEDLEIINKNKDVQMDISIKDTKNFGSEEKFKETKSKDVMKTTKDTSGEQILKDMASDKTEKEINKNPVKENKSEIASVSENIVDDMPQTDSNDKEMLTVKSSETEIKDNKEINSTETSNSKQTNNSIDLGNKLNEKPDFYRSDTVVEPEIIKKTVSHLSESSTDLDATQQDDKDDNNNTSKEESDLEKDVKSAVKKIVSTTPLEREITEAVKNILDTPQESTTEKPQKVSKLDSMMSVDTVLKQLPEVPTEEIPKTIVQKSLENTKQNTTATEDAKQINENNQYDETHSQISEKKTFDNNGSSASLEIPTDDVSSIGSMDSIVTVILKPKQDKDPKLETSEVKKPDKKLTNKALSTSAIEDHVVLLDQVQNSLLDQLSGKPVDTKSKFDIDQLRKELHDASTMYTSEDHGNDNDHEVMEYLYDFEPEDEAYDSRIVRTPLRELPDIAEETESKEEDGFCGTSNVNNDVKSANEHAEIIKPPKSHEIIIDNDSIKINKNDQKLLHTSELHDSVLVPTPYEFLYPPQSENANLKHTSEFHDTLVLPLPSGSDVTITNASKNLLPGEGSSQDSLEEHGNETSPQVPPAGASKTVTPPSRRRSPENRVDDVEEAQASLKDTSPAKPEPGGSHQSPPLFSTRTANQNMESERNNNKRNNAIVPAAEKNMEAQAATKIQAGFRGYQVRKQLKAKTAATDQKRQLRKRSSRENMKETNLEEKSAVKIQAGVRGFLVRRRQKKQVSGSASA